MMHVHRIPTKSHSLHFYSQFVVFVRREKATNTILRVVSFGCDLRKSTFQVCFVLFVNFAFM